MARPGLHLFEHLVHRPGIERPELRGGDGKTGWRSGRPERPETPGHRHRPGPPLLQGSTVEKGERPPGQDAVGER